MPECARVRAFALQILFQFFSRPSGRVLISQHYVICFASVFFAVMCSPSSHHMYAHMEQNCPATAIDPNYHRSMVASMRNHFGIMSHIVNTGICRHPFIFSFIRCIKGIQ